MTSTSTAKPRLTTSAQRQAHRLSSARFAPSETSAVRLSLKLNFSSRISATIRQVDPGSNRATAFNLPQFQGNRTFNQQISRRDRDFYRLTLSRESEVDVLWRNFSNGTLSVAVLNQRGVVGRYDNDRLFTTVRPRGRVRSDTDDLNAGTYFPRVTGSGKGRYQFRLTVDFD